MLEVPLPLAGQGQVTGLIPRLDHLPPAAGHAHCRWFTCVVTGAAAALSPKHPGRHPASEASTTGRCRWSSPPRPGWLLVLGALSFAAATLGRTARLDGGDGHRWHWIGLHLTGMSASYILLLTAFFATGANPNQRGGL
jgi:hypothetical protein